MINDDDPGDLGGYNIACAVCVSNYKSVVLKPIPWSSLRLVCEIVRCRADMCTLRRFDHLLFEWIGFGRLSREEQNVTDLFGVSACKFTLFFIYSVNYTINYLQFMLHR